MSRQNGIGRIEHWYWTVVLSVFRAVFANADHTGQCIPCTADSALSVMQHSHVKVALTDDPAALMLTCVRI